MSRSSACALLALFSLAPAVASADRPPPAVRHTEIKEPPRTQGDDLKDAHTNQPFLALRLFPVRLLGGVGQVGAELRILEKFSVLPQVGYGRVATKNPLTYASQRQSYTELELFGRYYPLGDMGEGLYASVGFSYASVDTDQLIRSPLLNLAAGGHAGVALGGNYRLPFHVSIDLQFLFAYRVLRVSPSTPSPPDLDRALALRVGAVLGLGYLF